MNPLQVLDLPGPTFLGVYVGAIMVAHLLGKFFALWCRRDHAQVGRTPDLAPLEIAYLAGGRARAVDAALAGLLQHEQIEIDGSGGRFAVGKGTFTPLTGLQAELYREIGQGRNAIEALRRQRTPTIARMEAQLGREGLLFSGASPEGRCTRVALAAPMLLVVALGAAKIAVGLARVRPVSFLVVLTLVALVMLGFKLFKHPLRSAHGNRALDALRRRNAALEATARRRGGELDEASLMLAVGLFGTAVLANGDLLWMQKGFVPQRSSSDGGGSSCGSSSGCGGGGGGGCGGCGGS